MSSPREWGCFPLMLFMLYLSVVFPARVGVFLPVYLYPIPTRGLPRASGGVSYDFFHIRLANFIGAHIGKMEEIVFTEIFQARQISSKVTFKNPEKKFCP